MLVICGDAGGCSITKRFGFDIFSYKACEVGQEEALWAVGRDLKAGTSPAPARPKSVDFGVKSKRSESLESIEETAVDSQIKGNTAKKISLFENKTSNQSHRQIDFYATKSIPLTKKYIGRAKLQFGKQANEAEQTDLSSSKQDVAQKSPENGRPVQKGLEEIKVKFEPTMEGESVVKAEAVSGASLKKKGSTGGSTPVQPQKVAVQVNSDKVDSVTDTVDKASVMPDTASSEHKQIHDLKEDIGTKNKEECTQPHESTTTLFEGQKEQDKTALLGQNVDSSVHSIPDKNSNKSSNQSVFPSKESCVETLENRVTSKGKKNSVKSPSRKGEKPTFKKNDRSKKKQPSSAKPSLAEDDLIARQPEESPKKHNSPTNVMAAPSVCTVNASKAVDLTCDSESSMQETSPSLDRLIQNGNNVSAELEKKVRHESTGISEHTDYGDASSQAGMQLAMESSDHAQEVHPSHKHRELLHNGKQSAVESVTPILLKDNSLHVVENAGNGTGEMNQSTFVDNSENTKTVLCEDAQGVNAELAEGACVTDTASTNEDLFDNGKNMITDLNESASFITSETKNLNKSEKADSVSTNSSENMLVSSGESTKIEISESGARSDNDLDKITPDSIIESTNTEICEKVGPATADSSEGAFVVPGEGTKIELSDDQGNVMSDSLTSESTQSELSENWEDAVADLNEIPPSTVTTNSEMTDTKELVSTCETRQENTFQDSVTVQSGLLELHQMEENLLAVNLEKTKTISQEQDASCKGQWQNVSDLQQNEEINMALKSHSEDLFQNEEISSYIVPDKCGENDLSDSIKQASKETKKGNETVQEEKHQISKDQTVHDGRQPLTDCQKGAPNIEIKCQNGDPVVQSGELGTHQKTNTQKQNVQPSVQELRALNSHLSNGSNVGHGFPFDQNGMFNSRSPSGVFTFSATSDDNHLDSSGEMEKFTEIIRQLDSPSTVHQKRKKQRIPRSPQPSFGLPPIREDYLEKILDSDMFTFGLGKKARAADLAPALMLKMQNTDNGTKIRPKRASTEQSFLVKALRTSGKDSSLTNECDGKENSLYASDPKVKRSRLEKSTVFSSLKSPLTTTSRENVFLPSVTSVDTITTSFSTSEVDSSIASSNTFDRTASSKTHLVSEIPQSSIPDQEPNGSLSSDLSTNRDTSHAGLKVPSYVEKYLKTDDEKQAQNLSIIPQPEKECTDLPKTDAKFDAPSNDSKNISGFLESIAKTNSSTLPDSNGEVLNRLNPSLRELSPALTVLEVKTGIENNEKINPRPGKVVIFSEPNFCGNIIEIFADVSDCSSWELSEVISIKIVRGCWLLYEKPNFEGLSIPLEEGEMELTNLWGEQIMDEKSTIPTVIGSIRQVVKDYRICQIDLFTESDGMGLVTSYFDDTEEVQVFDRLQKTCSIKVHWGIWLIYEDSGFQGVPFILEPGEYPNLAFWDTHEAYIGSMRPLKMGGRKVEIPNEPKICVYEKPFFEGMEFELDGEMFSLGEVQAVPGKEQSGKEQTSSFTTVASVRVLGGVWVGYEKPGFEGRQYLLEEGDYPLWSEWGGFNDQLQSLRPVLSDFSTSHMIMYSDRDFGEKGSNINVLGIISNMEDTGYGTKTQSINVLSGVWVAYENADFTGEQYVLEKGKYSRFEDWGATSFKISSVQPITLDTIGSPMGKFKVLLFSEPEFRGGVQVFEVNSSQIPDSFVTKSCKVLAGSWVAFDGEDFGGCQYILEEGVYPDLFSMGCQENAILKSLHIIDYEFSEPVIMLYGKQHCKGKKIEFTSENVSLQCLGYTCRVSSVEVLGGQWAIYEYSNYRGRQILLSPDKIPDWYKLSGWHTIGSLRPLIQKRVYFRIRNKSTGMFVGTNGNLDDLKMLRLQVTEDTGAEDQIWAFHEGFLKCRIAEDCCVSVSGSLVISGSKLSLSLEEEKSDSQLWSIIPDGRIRSRMKPNLVFDIKGGTQYDQKHMILNTECAEKETQCWELLVL